MDEFDGAEIFWRTMEVHDATAGAIWEYSVQRHGDDEVSLDDSASTARTDNREKMKWMRRILDRWQEMNEWLVWI